MSVGTIRAGSFGRFPQAAASPSSSPNRWRSTAIRCGRRTARASLFCAATLQPGKTAAWMAGNPQTPPSCGSPPRAATPSSSCPHAARAGRISRMKKTAFTFTRHRDSFRFVTTARIAARTWWRSEEHTSELQSRLHLVCRLLLEKKKKQSYNPSKSHYVHHRTLPLILPTVHPHTHGDAHPSSHQPMYTRAISRRHFHTSYRPSAL